MTHDDRVKALIMRAEAEAAAQVARIEATLGLSSARLALVYDALKIAYLRGSADQVDEFVVRMGGSSG